MKHLSIQAFTAWIDIAYNQHFRLYAPTSPSSDGWTKTINVIHSPYRFCPVIPWTSMECSNVFNNSVVFSSERKYFSGTCSSKMSDNEDALSVLWNPSR